jgi:hypothetical protein
MLNDLDLSTFPDEGARQAIRELLNLVETLARENRALREENQRLRHEINRLKGEQGAPSIRPQTKPSAAPAPDHSSERERHVPKPRTRGRKVERITIDHTRVLTIDPASLPEDAEFKDYVPTVVQDVRLTTENICFLKEKFYSAAEGKTYLAFLPAGYDGAFGPGLRALVLVLAHACQMTEPKIVALVRHLGVLISDGMISNLLIRGHSLGIMCLTHQLPVVLVSRRSLRYDWIVSASSQPQESAKYEYTGSTTDPPESHRGLAFGHDPGGLSGHAGDERRHPDRDSSGRDR